MSPELAQNTVQNDDFMVTISAKGDEETVVVTSFAEQLTQYEDKILIAALKDYDATKKQYSAYTLDKSSNDTLTPTLIDELSNGIQSDLTKVLTANGLIRKYIITDDIIGKTYESIESNVNTNYKLSYSNFTKQRNKSKKLDTVKATVETFNRQINLRQLIRDSIPLTYAEGTYILCLRYDGNSYTVDHYPLGVAYVSEYTFGGKPVVCIDIKELENRLKKTYSKDKKNKPIFFENIEKDIQANYPKEVYDAYKRKESTVRLDTRYTGVLRIGNLGRRYGVSPILRALKSALMLENFENSDYIGAKAKAKKIIHQVMRKEAMGEAFKNKGLEMTAHAHKELLNAWQNKTVVYTSCPQVEKVTYVESAISETNAEKINTYRSKIMTTLGIGFIDTSVANFSVSKISLEQLMKTINAISEQLERIIQDWYQVLFENENLDMEYLPTIQILDSEQMDMEMKKSLVELLYSKLNCSMETAFELLGYSLEDEKQKRINENADKLDEEIFLPHNSQYTAGEKSPGRTPESENNDKQTVDKQYNKDARA